MDVEEFFWSRVKPGDGCWQWTGPERGKGYGGLYHGGESYYAHRFSWELHNGPIPEGLQIDHLCRNRICVNPGHLRVVTQRENLLAGETIVAAHAAKTHCVNGHEFNEGNTYHWRGVRYCRTCRNNRMAARRLAGIA